MLLTIAARNLLSHRRRTLLLGGAIGGVTCLLVLLLGLVNGIQTGLFESLTGLFTGHVNLEGFYKPTPGRSQAAVVGFPELEELVRRELPEVEEVVSRGRGWAKVASDTNSMQLAVLGVDIQQDRRIRESLNIKEGSLDALREPNTIVIFDAQAKRMEVKLGDALTITAPVLTGAYNALDVRVVAIAHTQGILSEMVSFLPNATVRELYGLSADTTGALQLYLHDVDQADQVHRKLRTLLADRGHALMEDDPRIYYVKTQKVNSEDWIGQRLDVSTYVATMSYFAWLATVLRGIAITLVSVLMLLILVGLMNALWMAIRERTREIGTLRAIGMQRDGVLRMFLAEAFLLSFTSTLVGALLGTLGCWLLTRSAIPVPTPLLGLIMTQTLVFQPALMNVLGALLVITLGTTLISLLPSLRAARLRPVTAMHHLG